MFAIYIINPRCQPTVPKANGYCGRWQYSRADSSFAPSQWETVLLCNDVSHWLGASLESALYSSLLVFHSWQLEQFPPIEYASLQISLLLPSVVVDIYHWPAYMNNGQGLLEMISFSSHISSHKAWKVSTTHLRRNSKVYQPFKITLSCLQKLVHNKNECKWKDSVHQSVRQSVSLFVFCPSFDLNTLQWIISVYPIHIWLSHRHQTSILWFLLDFVPYTDYCWRSVEGYPVLRTEFLSPTNLVGTWPCPSFSSFVFYVCPFVRNTFSVHFQIYHIGVYSATW